MGGFGTFLNEIYIGCGRHYADKLQNLVNIRPY